MAKDAKQLAQGIGHSFRDAAFLEQALTHSSFANEQDESEQTSLPVRDNEQFEFLGDSVLGLVTSEHLFQSFPDYSEGQLSKLRAHLVSARYLSKVARQLHLGEYLRLGRGEERTGGRMKQAILADTVEAVIAALYLDGGFPAAQSFILKHVIGAELARMGDDPAASTATADFKSSLQEFLQSKGQAQPSYEVVAQNGPEHKKIFCIQLNFDGGPDDGFTGEGSSIKRAEQRAAEQALRHLRNPTGQQPA